MIKLKVGYLLEIIDIMTNVTSYATITYGELDNKKNRLCISGEDTWFPLKELNRDTMGYALIRVLKVYGRASNMNAWKLEPNDRKLLWSREDIS